MILKRLKLVKYNNKKIWIFDIYPNFFIQSTNNIKSWHLKKLFYVYVKQVPMLNVFY